MTVENIQKIKDWLSYRAKVNKEFLTNTSIEIDDTKHEICYGVQDKGVQIYRIKPLLRALDITPKVEARPSDNDFPYELSFIFEGTTFYGIEANADIDDDSLRLGGE